MPRPYLLIPAVILMSLLLAATPTTHPADPLTTLATNVAAKSANQSVVLILRPDQTGANETPTAIAAIKDAVTQALQTANVTLVSSDDADTELRSKAVAGQPNIPAIAPLITTAKANLLLCGVVRRVGDSHKIAFTLLSATAPVTQLAVSLSVKSLTTTGNDVDLADAAIVSAVKPAITGCMDPIQTAEIKSIQIAVVPQTPTDAGTAGFEMALYDTVAQALHHSKLETKTLVGITLAANLQPAVVAKMKDLPEDSAILQIRYTRKPGGTIVTLAVVSAKAKVATATTGIDPWDVAAMPAMPVLNARVLAYSEAQKDTKVGNGECWTLAAEALKDAKAKHADGYTYGRKLLPGEPIYPGDIMQFTEAKFEGHNGGSTWWVQLGFPNHTAVVRKVLGPTKYEILQQNPGPVKVGTIDFKDLKSGKWETWRPQAR